MCVGGGEGGRKNLTKMQLHTPVKLLRDNFSRLLRQHLSGTETFATLPVVWHLFCGTDPSVTETWKEISVEQKDLQGF